MNPGNGDPIRAVARYLAEIGASSATGEDLVMALTRRTAGETFDVDGLALLPELLLSVPESLAFEHRILPVHRAGDVLFVAVPAGPIPDDVLDELEHLLGLQVEAISVSEIDVPGVLVKAHQLLRRKGRTAAAPRTEPGTAAPGGRAFADLGLPAEILKRLQRAMAEPQGLLLVAGPAGSGKSTTLNAIVAEWRRRGQRVAALDFSAGLGALETELGADPDAVAIDGTGSPSVASGAVRAALEGRRVLLTVEAADGTGAVARLAALNVDPHLVSTALLGALNQRLLRRTCARCSVVVAEEAATLEDLRLEVLLRGIPLRRGRGCEACRGTGSDGGLAVFEYGERGAERTVRGGFQPLVADALAKLVAGHTTLKDVVEQVPYTQILQAADRLNVRKVSL